MRLFCTISLVFGLLSNLFAQNTNAQNYWKPVKPESISLPELATRTVEPLASKTFQLDYAALNTALQQAPMEFTAAARQQPVLLSLPLADGSFKSFKIWESPVMASELTAKFPELRTYAGPAADGSGNFVRLGTGPLGFHAFIFGASGEVQSVRPYSEGQQEFYMVYRLKDLPNDLPGGGAVACGVNDAQEFLAPNQGQNHFVQDRGNAVVQIKKYRAAIAARGEYTQFYGSKAAALDAIKIALNFIVAIQERDFGVRMELIPNNDTIIFTDPATDPYSGETVGDWMSQNPAAINPIIGVNSYDVGHVFSRYIMGDQVGVVNGRVCNNITKARGASSAQNTSTEYFYLVAAHEMCHQLSGSHTWSNCPPFDNQLAPSYAYEPGSGSTVMSYAGSCSNNNNVENDNDPYYHVATILQVQEFIWQGDGAGCGTVIDLVNDAPEVTLPLADGFYTPINTPFVLTGSATDANGDNLTYCWEEYDLGPSGQLGAPTFTAPAFRSFPPTDDPSRIFPRINSIVFNQQNPTEVLPTYSREFNFKLTARDGKSGVGIGSVKFFATEQAGPFRVTSPNTNSVVWNMGEYQTITWDLANTDKAPVNCKTVNILLSLNNGLLYPITLATGVPNIGKYCLQVPASASNNARIRVQAADNIFFDISDAGFKIQAATQPDFSICTERLGDLICAPTAYMVAVNTAASAGFSDAITLSATGLPPGATATFSPNPVTPGSTSTMTIDFTSAVDEGSFDLTVSATANGNTKTSVISYRVVQNNFSALALLSPANGAQSVDLGPWLYWNGVADADKYEIQVASNPSFDAGTILFSNANLVADSFKVSLLNEGQIGYWRVRPINDCGAGPWTDPFVFVTKVQNCGPLVANDLPKNITGNGTPTVESKITVASGSVFSDVNVKKVQGSHEFMKDLEVRLISPAGTDVLLFKDKCPGFSGNFNVGFDDSANGPFGCPPPNNGSFAKPTELLSAFIGENSTGTWTLRVKDNVISSGGQLIGFELEFCSSVALNAPFIVNNNTLQVMPGTNAVIGEDLLKAEDPNNAPLQLLFTLLTVPDYGDLRINGVVLLPGAQFTQEDITNGVLRYYEWGFNTGADNFQFSVTDGEGGLANGTFNIQPFPVSTKEPLGNIAFGLAPNPASESVRLFVTEALDADSRVTLFNTAGQQLRSWTLSAGATALLLNVADLPEGVYAVSVENEKGRGVKKVVVQ